MASAVVLCIDDQLAALELRKAELEAFGFSVAIAHSAAEGIRLLDVLPIAVVVLEHKSEGMDAQAVAFHVRHKDPKLPIIVISAFVGSRAQAQEWADVFVLKGTHLRELADIIRRFLSRCRIRKGAAA